MFQNNSTKIDKARRIAVRLTVAVLMFLLGMFLAYTGEAQKPLDKPGNFYAVTGNGLKDTSWIFGTYHLVKNSYLNEVPAVEAAFKRSKGVAVELVIDSTELSMAAAMGMLKDKTLTGLLDKPFIDSLENELKATLGVGISQIDQLKPINVALTLSMVYLISDKNTQLQKYSGKFLDAYFAETGKQAGKNIAEFETLQEQMDLLFNKSSNEEQADQLRSFLRNKTEMIAQGKALVENWFSHDLEKMYEVSEKSLRVFRNDDDLLKKRNEKWMKSLPGLLEKESQFIAVGALHLAGPDGLIKQLQKQGYTVTPVKL